MTNQCEHGQLARVCELCAKDAEIAQLRQYLDTAQRRAGALGDEVAGLREALQAADASFEAVEIYMPDGCKEEFAFYADWEDVRAALAARKGTT